MRIELIHPLIVHFPLALLLMGTALRFAHFLLRKTRFAHTILFSSWTLLVLGVCFAWFAIFAGEIAEDIVRKGLCKPEILDHHINLAYSAAILFSTALLIDLGKTWKKFSFSNFFILPLTIALLYTTATVILILTGSYGANLVYEQGAAVEGCKVKAITPHSGL